MLTTTKKLNKKQQTILDAYNNSDKKTIYDAYSKPSQTKINSYYKLVKYFDNNFDIYGYRITSYNQFNYSITFVTTTINNNPFYIEDRETTKTIHYITKQNTYTFDI